MTHSATCFVFTKFGDALPVKDDVFTAAKHVPTYVSQGEEICPKTSRPHIQGYIQFAPKLRVTYKYVKDLLDASWVMPARGTDIENYVYTGKEGSRHEFGERRSDIPERKDIRDIGRHIEEGATMPFLYHHYPNQTYRMGKGMQEHINMVTPDRTIKPYAIISYGKTGTGKSRGPMESNQGKIFRKKKGKWWNGYHGQSVVIWDEFKPCPYYDVEETLQMLDHYLYEGETKGGMVKLTFEKIYFSHNKHPSKWFHYFEDQEDAFMRRIEEIWEFTETGGELVGGTKKDDIKAGRAKSRRVE